MAANEIEIDDDLIQAVLDGNKTQLRIPLGNTSNFGTSSSLATLTLESFGLMFASSISLVCELTPSLWKRSNPSDVGKRGISRADLKLHMMITYC